MHSIAIGLPAGQSRATGASAALGYRLRAARLSATLGAGYALRRTLRRLSVGPSSRFTEPGLTFQGDLFFQAKPLTNVNAIVSYADANRYLWARTGVKRQFTNTQFRGPVALAIGAEGTAQGHPIRRSSRNHTSVSASTGHSKLASAELTP